MGALGDLLIYVIGFFGIVGVAVLIIWIVKSEDKRDARRNRPDASITDGKKYDVNMKVLTRFLDQADEAYIQAFQQINVEPFVPFCTVPLAMKLNNEIIYNNTREFSTKEHRKRNWTVEQVFEETLLVKKDMTFELMREAHGQAYIPYADPIHEIWKLTYGPTRFCVIDINVC